MKDSEIANLRLINQQIAASRFKTPKEIVSWMGAMQAQDYTMAKWAIGSRLKNVTEKQIEDAFNKGEILRTHVMRPTWHFVTAEDIYWMLELTAPRILSSLKHRQNHLELTPDILSKSNKLLEKLLSSGKHLAREEIRPEYAKAKIALDNNRMSHLMLWAELNGIVCSGAMKNNKQTYALLSKRVPEKNIPTKEESLAKLAERFFLSHGPATITDFLWWSGLSAKDARDGLEMIKSKLVSEKLDTKTYWFSNALKISKNKSSAYLLPAFDEYVISYKDRTAMIELQHHKKAISDNGIFRPIIVINGQVSGLWTRTLKKDHVVLETQFFRKHGKAEIELLRNASKKYSSFLKMDLKFKNLNF
ncbi:MAG: winged helix DNA-binding domain-containing protein [Chitinophagales bacterium]